MIKFRQLNLGDLDYTLITRESDKNPFYPPQDFGDEFFYQLRTFPKSVIQLSDPLAYFQSSKYIRKDTPLRFSVLYEPNLDLYFASFPIHDAIKVIFLDKNVNDKHKVMRLFNQHYKLVFFVLIEDVKSSEKSGNRIIKNVYNLFDELNKNKSLVEELINKNYEKANFKLRINFENDDGDSFNEPVYFNPAQVNYFTMNQAIGNYWMIQNLTMKKKR